LSLSFICQQLGYTRQAYYKNRKHQGKQNHHQQAVKQQVLAIRSTMPRLGTRKLYYLLAQDFKEQNLKMGRDALFTLLRQEDLLVKKKKRYQRTTDSSGWMRQYPDLTRELELKRPEQLWVADITYVSLKEGFCYLHLLTDAYSKKIMGYRLGDSLQATHSVAAFKMALSQCSFTGPLIHHSDRGLQYCSSVYSETLKTYDIQISMTQDGSPYDNAVAERINGILKDEFGLDEVFENFLEAKKQVSQSIHIYNQKRPHLSNHYLTPDKMHQQQKLKPKTWKKKATKTTKCSSGS
jgi:transposase InsO family protein